jgi:hypothetical protein
MPRIAYTYVLPALILSIAPFHDAEAGVQVVQQPGNPSCPAGTIAFKLDPPESGTFDVDGGEVTVDLTTMGCFDWGSTFGMDAVIAKGGPNGNVYTYTPESIGDDGVCTPINPKNNKRYGLSHITFCYDRELEISKTANPSFDRTWDWSIMKDTVPPGIVTLELLVEEVFHVMYEVVLDAVSSDSNWGVSGTITIENPWNIGATVTGVTDVIKPDNVSATVDCGVSFPYSLPAGSELVCSYSKSLPDGAARTNKATVTTSGPIAGNSVTVPFSFGEPTDEIDECVDVTDSVYGDLGMVCADDEDEDKVFEYTVPITFDVCEEFVVENVTSFVTNDTGAEGEDGHTINVEVVGCDGGEGCVFSPGYYKNHPDDPRWVDVLGPSGKNTSLFTTDLTYFQAVSMQGTPCTNLARQYAAATLNGAPDSPSDEVVDAYDLAAQLLIAEGSFQTCELTANAVDDIIEILDAFNNGLTEGAPHC